MRYAFEDKFTGSAGAPPDPAKWTHELGRWPFNDELETYTDSQLNSYQDGQGHLVISAMSIPGTPGQYTSARLTTQGKFEQACGFWEARIKLPAQHGLWPAWWVMGAGWPDGGEIDIVENYGYREAETTVHIPDGAGGMLPPLLGVTYRDVFAGVGWNTYRMRVSPSLVTFQLNGSIYLSVRPGDGAWPYGSTPLFMILNLAVGGAAGLVVPTTQFPASMLVDYVRAGQ